MEDLDPLGGPIRGQWFDSTSQEFGVVKLIPCKNNSYPLEKFSALLRATPEQLKGPHDYI